MIKRRQMGQLARIAFVRRPLSSSPQRIQPTSDDKTLDIGTSMNFNTKHKDSIMTPNMKSTPIEKPIENSHTISPIAIEPKEKSRQVSPKIDQKPKQSTTPNESPKKSQSWKEWWNSLTPKQRFWFKMAVIALAVLALCIIITLATVLPLVVFKKNEETSAANTRSICAKTTCIGYETPKSGFTTITFPFDGNLNDLSGLYTGIGYGSSAPGYSNNLCIGSQSLLLNSPSSSQYVQIPEIHLASRSFTIETYISIGGSIPAADYGIFCQCSTNSICLSIHLRFGRIAVSFDSMNTNRTLTSSSLVNTGDWNHIAVVYDSTSYQLLIYMDGIVNAVSIGVVSPFQGQKTGSVTTIGRALSAAYGTSYFSGRIDHFTISPGTARTACQIYNDATLVAHFPFDSPSVTQDNSVNNFNGVGSSFSVITGRISQAIYMNSNSSYFQSEAFATPDTNNAPFSISLWINPASLTNGGSLVHFSTIQNGNSSYCYDIMSLTASGEILVQVINSITVVTGLMGPVIQPNTWTHVVMVYAPSNGMRIYINGALETSSQNVTSINTVNLNEPHFITLGNNSPNGQSGSVSCRSGHVSIVSGPFIGGIDDFRLYSRELDTQEICVLSQM